MCGWVGVFGAPERRAALRAAAATLASRGPDGSGERVISEGPLQAGLAHRRLAILDPTPAGAQPMYDEQRGVSVVYNGEIYNSPELRKELEAKGVRFRSGSDTEVLLLGWAEWGDEILQRIEGIFSFALLDERRGRALLARDRMGVKPLYWAMVDGALVAGSAPRAILSLRPKLRPQLDRIALAQFLTLLWIPHPRTPWSAIKKLPPATAMSFAGGDLRTWRYWTAPEPTDEPPDVDDLRDRLEAATKRQLLSDVPVGLLLSGGLDSTLLLAFMARHYDGPKLHALTAGYEAAAQRLEIVPDDMGYARLAAAQYPQVDLTEVVIGGDPCADLDALAFHFDDPVADPAAITLYRLCLASDTKVLLSGVGGEELFAGYPRHERLGTARTAARLPRQVRRFLGNISPVLRGGRAGALNSPRRNVQKLTRAIGDRGRPHYWRMMAQLTFTELHSLMPDAAATAFNELDAQSPPMATTTLGQALTFDRYQFLPNLNLGYVDKAAMAAGVEVRVPLLDEAVVGIAFKTDPSAMIAGSASKAPLRDAARHLVPPTIIERSKAGFGGPVRSWFREPNSYQLKERVDALSEVSLIKPNAARAIFDDATTGRNDAALSAWSLVFLERWLGEHGAAAPDRTSRMNVHTRLTMSSTPLSPPSTDLHPPERLGEP